MEKSKGYRVFEGTVRHPGWPIDGMKLRLAEWDYDPGHYHLYDWADDQDEAVMKTMFQTETEAEICLYDSLEDFEKDWKAGQWEPQGVFCIPGECIVV